MIACPPDSPHLDPLEHLEVVLDPHKWKNLPGYLQDIKNIVVADTTGRGCFARSGVGAHNTRQVFRMCSMNNVGNDGLIWLIKNDTLKSSRVGVQ